MTDLLSCPDPDPRPQAPERPLASDCCDSGCPVCVHDLYAEELLAYATALAAWEQRHTGSGATALQRPTDERG